MRAAGSSSLAISLFARKTCLPTNRFQGIQLCFKKKNDHCQQQTQRGLLKVLDFFMNVVFWVTLLLANKYFNKLDEVRAAFWITLQAHLDCLSKRKGAGFWNSEDCFLFHNCKHQGSKSWETHGKEACHW